MFVGLVSSLGAPLGVIEPRHNKTCPRGFRPGLTQNQAVQPQITRCLKCKVMEVEGSYYLYSKYKGTDQPRGYNVVNLCLCFHICKRQIFS